MLRRKFLPLFGLLPFFAGRKASASIMVSPPAADPSVATIAALEARVKALENWVIQWCRADQAIAKQISADRERFRERAAL